MLLFEISSYSQCWFLSTFFFWVVPQDRSQVFVSSHKPICWGLWDALARWVWVSHNRVQYLLVTWMHSATTEIGLPQKVFSMKLKSFIRTLLLNCYTNITASVFFYDLQSHIMMLCIWLFFLWQSALQPLNKNRRYIFPVPYPSACSAYSHMLKMQPHHIAGGPSRFRWHHQSVSRPPPHLSWTAQGYFCDTINVPNAWFWFPKEQNPRIRTFSNQPLFYCVINAFFGYTIYFILYNVYYILYTMYVLYTIYFLYYFTLLFAQSQPPQLTHCFWSLILMPMTCGNDTQCGVPISVFIRPTYPSGCSHT